MTSLDVRLSRPADLLERSEAHLPAAPIRRRVEAPGIVASVATREVGLAVIALGGGRTRPQDGIDPAVGLTDLARPGDAGGLLGVIHAADEASADRAEASLRAAYRMGEAPPERPAVIERVDA